MMNQQLANVDASAAKEKWITGLPVNLKEFAVAQGFGYNRARDIARMAGFPCFAGLIYPEDYRLWRQQQIVLAPSSQPIAARRLRSSAGRSGRSI